MNTHEQRMCEMQADLFEYSTERFSCGSSFFVARFMNSEMAKELDDIDNPYNFISPNNMIMIMNSLYPSLTNNVGQIYPKKVMRWIGYVYRAWSIIKKRYSYKIYKSVKTEKMLSLYDSFHTLSIESCVERLDEMFCDNLPLEDYEIFKQIKNQSREPL